MSPPSETILRRIAAETGYQADALEKTIRLLEILQAINSNPFLRNRLALSGGTGLNIFHLDLARLSVDIDLNYIGALDRETMLTERPRVEVGLEHILAFQGYNIHAKPRHHTGGKWILRFSSALGSNATLELDMNYSDRQPLFGTTRLHSARIGEYQAKDILVLDIHEIIAGKLVALFSRHTGRDFFDARRILSIEGLDWNNIKAAFLALGINKHKDWRTISPSALENAQRRRRNNLAACLRRKHFHGRGKFHQWLRETISLCQQEFAFLFDRTPNETQFMDDILDRGEINADLLDVAPQVRARLAAMPGLAWKCQQLSKSR